MGNIHTPKTIYKNGLVVDFYVKKKIVFYKISRWINEGINQVSLASGKLSDFKSPEEIMEYALVHFSAKTPQQKVGDGTRN